MFFSLKKLALPPVDKNVGWVTVVVNPSDYEHVLENINEENEIN